MHHPSRPSNRSDGSTAVTTTEGSGGDPPPVGAAGASAQTSRSNDGGERSCGNPDSTAGGEPDSPSWCRARARARARTPADSLGVLQNVYRRASSGYFSFDGDSLPSSPVSPRPVTADRATQTPSPTGQVVKHALQRMAEAHGGGTWTRQQHGQSPSPSSTQQRNTAGDMQREEIGRVLRNIGDDYNQHLLLRAEAQRRVVIHPNPLPHIHQEPTVLLCMGLLLLLIGRIIYLQRSINSQDLSQV